MAVLNSLTQTKVCELQQKMLWEPAEMKGEDSEREVKKFYYKERTAGTSIYEIPELSSQPGLRLTDREDEERAHLFSEEAITLSLESEDIDDDDESVNSYTGTE